MTGQLCKHPNLDIEDTVQDHLGINGHYQTEHQIYVCADCGETVEGDPALDRAEVIADMEVDRMLDERDES